jgi:hypothetical protein
MSWRDMPWPGCAEVSGSSKNARVEITALAAAFVIAAVTTPAAPAGRTGGL